MINILVNSGYSFLSLRKSLTNYLKNKNQNIRIILPNNFIQIKKNFTSKNIKLKKYYLHNRKENFFNLLKNSINLYKIFRNYKDDVNIIFGSYLILVFGIFSFFIKSKKNIFVFTGLGSFFNSKKFFLINIIKFFINILVIQKNNFFIFYNIADRNFFLKKKYTFKSKIILGSGIKITKGFKKKIIKNKINFIFFSRFNSDKGILDLVKAIQIVNSKGYKDKCKFYFYGLYDSNPTAIKKRLLKRLILSHANIKLYETSYEINLDKIFNDVDVFVLPSYREGLPKTALEAMNYGCALLLSDIPGHKVLINSKKINGLFFKKKNEIDLSNKIIWMIKNKNKLKTFSKNSKKNLIQFSEKKINKMYYETIK
jgi:glycosyltransferase involved in cell wall biosynthesis